MFTGLIESVGEIASMAPVPGGFRLEVRTGLAPDLRPGDSLAVNGVCLTAVAISDGTVAADVSPETARVTSLGTLQPGSLVNLERPLRADARLGGHFVQGHVDATGTIAAIEPEGDSHRVAVTYPRALAANLVSRGSIAVDGISLTLASVEDDRFTVQIIPYTWAHTNLRCARVGRAVNLECDILGKYVARLMNVGQVRPGQ
ncbi:MAG TPA: riboflavin synthase [Vicinamibacterales bacterium]|nr:riboflavin synthase [Vicinamibacterales bacterium]